MCDGHNHTLPCISGGKGRFPQFTSMPQHFKNHGFLTMGVGKLFHDGEAHVQNSVPETEAQTD